MAVDTVRLRSPYISEELAMQIERECTKRLGIDCKTGDLLYEITTGSLEASHDSRISIKVLRREYRSQTMKGFGALINTRTKVKTVLVDCPPYIEIEASVHKLVLGHNIYGGSERFQLCCRLLLHTVEELLGVQLPGFQNEDYEKHWLVLRVDYAYVFHLGKFEAVEQFFYLMKNSYYPRRSISSYGLTGLSANASTSVCKFYAKGPEFRKHDFKRLVKKGVLTESQAFELLELAAGILRVEVELKSRKLKYDFQNLRYGHEPYIKDVTDDYLRKAFVVEVDRIMKEGKKKTDIMRDSLLIRDRLLYGSGSLSKGNALYAAYLQISNFGLHEYKKKASKATYYRHLKELKEAGVSFNLSQEIEVETATGEEYLLPADFQPLRDDERRMSGEDSQFDALAEELIEKYIKKRAPIQEEPKMDDLYKKHG